MADETKEFDPIAEDVARAMKVPTPEEATAGVKEVLESCPAESLADELAWAFMGTLAYGARNPGRFATMSVYLTAGFAEAKRRGLDPMELLKSKVKVEIKAVDGFGTQPVAQA